MMATESARDLVFIVTYPFVFHRLAFVLTYTLKRKIAGDVTGFGEPGGDLNPRWNADFASCEAEPNPITQTRSINQDSTEFPKNRHASRASLATRG